MICNYPSIPGCHALARPRGWPSSTAALELLHPGSYTTLILLTKLGTIAILTTATGIALCVGTASGFTRVLVLNGSAGGATHNRSRRPDGI